MIREKNKQNETNTSVIRLLGWGRVIGFRLFRSHSNRVAADLIKSIISLLMPRVINMTRYFPPTATHVERWVCKTSRLCIKQKDQQIRADALKRAFFFWGVVSQPSITAPGTPILQVVAEIERKWFSLQFTCPSAWVWRRSSILQTATFPSDARCFDLYLIKCIARFQYTTNHSAAQACGRSVRKHDNGEKNQFRLHDNEPSGSLLAVLPVPYLLPVTSCSSSPTLCGFPIFDIADKSRSNLNKTIMPSRPLRPAQASSSSERAHARAVLPTQAFPTSIGEKMATVSTVVRWHDVLSLRLAPVLLSLTRNGLHALCYRKPSIDQTPSIARYLCWWIFSQHLPSAWEVIEMVSILLK